MRAKSVAAWLFAVLALGPASSQPTISATMALRLSYAGPPDTWPRPHLRDGAVFKEMGLLAGAEPPDAKRAALGAQLIADQRLSAKGDVSCATCHRQEQAWADDRALSHGAGGKATRRNTPSLLHASRLPLLDWDGKAQSLEARALAPLFDPAEMGPQTDAEFEERFGMDVAEIGLSLAAYIRTLERASRFDHFLAGETTALRDRELQGLHLFRTKAGCANCHSGPLLTDGRFHNLRLSSFGEASEDLGRHDVTSVPDDAGRFRTPSLRHVSRTAPYMHNGLLPSLRAVVNFYARGGGEVRARNAAEAARPLFQEASRLSSLVRSLTLSESEREALVAFLESL